MQTKPCFKCLVEKPLTEFYRHPKMADRTLGKCKECTKADVRANRAAKADYYREWDRARNKNPHRAAASIEKNRRKARKIGPAYYAAHNAVTRAVKRGKIIRPSCCERCGATERIQGHHDDYTKPLEVMWLCPICHANRHRELGRLGQRKKATP